MPTNNLEVLRKDKRKTIRDVAAETKIGQTAVWKMENGLQGISDVYAITLAKYYGVTTDFLFGISDLKNGIKETIVYKDRDITYQAVLENINKFSKDDLLKLSGEYGFTKMPVHNLRHYFASRCLTNGIDKKTYSLWLGHENIDISADYSHVTSDFERDQIALMAKRGRK